MELKFKVPKELEEQMKRLSNVEVSLLVSRMIEDRLTKLARLKSIVSKSKLTEEDVKELSNKIDKSLSQRFKQSIKE